MPQVPHEQRVRAVSSLEDRVTLVPHEQRVRAACSWEDRVTLVPQVPHEPRVRAACSWEDRVTLVPQVRQNSVSVCPDATQILILLSVDPHKKPIFSYFYYLFQDFLDFFQANL